MSKKNKNVSLRDIKESAIQDILLPNTKNSKKVNDKESVMETSSDSYVAQLDMLTSSSSHESGSDPVDENPMIKPTPLDAHAHVRVNDGKLVFSTESIADENKHLWEEVKDLKRQLLEAKKSVKDHPDTSLSKNTKTGGLGISVSEEQFNRLCNAVSEQVLDSIRKGQNSGSSNATHAASDSFGLAKASTSQIQVSRNRTSGVQKLNLSSAFDQRDSEEEIEEISSEEG